MCMSYTYFLISEIFIEVREEYREINLLFTGRPRGEVPTGETPGEPEHHWILTTYWPSHVIMIWDETRLPTEKSSKHRRDRCGNPLT